MKTFTTEDGRDWVATAWEEDTPRHHGRWYLVLHPADAADQPLAVPEIRWKTRRTAERTVRSMSDFELQRRVRSAVGRQESAGMERDTFGDWKDAAPGAKGGTESG